MPTNRRPHHGRPLMRHARAVVVFVIAALGILANASTVAQMAQTTPARLTRLRLP